MPVNENTNAADEETNAAENAGATPTSGVPASGDGIVQGDENDNRIDFDYTDDPQGDRVDHNDALLGNVGSNDDIIKAGAGNDTIFAGEGNDDAYGNEGNDKVVGEAGDDTLRGNDGDDTLIGGAGQNFLEGGTGDDVFVGGEGADSIFAGEGHDVVDYSSSADPVNVNLDTNTLSGGDAENDTIDPATRLEGAIGSDGDDTFVGGDGENSFVGGEGDDDFTTGAGDTVYGDGGDDYFRIADDQLSPGETITIAGGETGETNGDTLDLRGQVDDPDTQISYTNSDPAEGGGLTGVATLNDGTIVDFTEIENILTDGTPPPPPTGADGIVSGTDGDDTIDTAYTGDPDGDMIDNDDAILGPNPGSDDDIVEAGDGDDTVRAGEGDDDVDGGDGDDLLFGDEGDDTLNDGSGADTAIGGEGNDVIDVSGGDPAIDDPVSVIPGVLEPDEFPDDDRDSVAGDGGDDLISTGDDADTIYGGDGNDTINPGIDNDLVFGGAGDDLIDDLQGADTIDGGDGDDTILAGVDTFSDYVGDDPNLPAGESDPNTEDGRDSINGGAGDDLIRTGDDRDTIRGGEGNDTINAGIDDDMVWGDAGDDSIIGSHGSDTILGGEGNDTIYGGFGPEPIAGFLGEEPDATDPVPENGRDSIDGGAGDDVIYGEDDDDTLNGGSGNDYLDGGVDDDVLDGGQGDDTLIGGQGDDALNGAQGNDSIDAGTGDDTVTAGFGDDTVDAGDGDDEVVSGAGDDVVLGGDGNDTIEGNDGEDAINGGAGDDLLMGNDDADTFSGLNGGDTVLGGAGFGPDSSDHDTLNLAGSIAATPDAVRFELQDTVTDSDGNGIDGSVVYFDAAGNEVGKIDFENIEEIVPCFTPGTLVATPQGERLVEELQVGDRVITRDNGMQEIRWAGHKPLDGRALRDAPHMQPVLIKAGALGNGLPERDMLVSPNHRMLIANDKTSLFFEEREVLVAAKHLVDGKGVMQVQAHATTYIHFLFDQHEVVLADGAWSESFQPGDYSLKGIGEEQRSEIFELFPELEQVDGLLDYHAARRTLKKHEAKLLQK